MHGRRSTPNAYIDDDRDDAIIAPPVPAQQLPHNPNICNEPVARASSACLFTAGERGHVSHCGSELGEVGSSFDRRRVSLGGSNRRVDALPSGYIEHLEPERRAAASQAKNAAKNDEPGDDRVGAALNGPKRLRRLLYEHEAFAADVASDIRNSSLGDSSWSDVLSGYVPTIDTKTVGRAARSTTVGHSPLFPRHDSNISLQRGFGNLKHILLEWARQRPVEAENFAADVELLTQGMPLLPRSPQIAIAAVPDPRQASSNPVALLERNRRERILLDAERHAADWNARFQSLLELPEETHHKYRQLQRTANDFVHAAKSFARIIVSEMCLPVEQRLIKPLSDGRKEDGSIDLSPNHNWRGATGIAGGMKFVVHNILFKFALDQQLRSKDDPHGEFWMYGGSGRLPNHEAAMKAAGHELKGLQQFQGCGLAGLHFPLIAVITYKGFRLVAVSVLPIGKETIKYGSCDGGQTVHDSDGRLSVLMRNAGIAMNLRGHITGKNGPILYSPFDVEAHLGYDDKFYVVDFARTFPPQALLSSCADVDLLSGEAQRQSKRAVFFQLLRPEWVRRWRKPLSSDAFCPAARLDPKFVEWNDDVVEASEALLRDELPALAASLDTLVLAERGAIHANELVESRLLHVLVSRVDISHEAHRRGVNLRHLGAVIGLTQEIWTVRLILHTMVARTLKHLLRRLMRYEMLENTSTVSDEPFKDTVLLLFNDIVGPHQQSRARCHHVTEGLIVRNDVELDCACVWQWVLDTMYTKYIRLRLPDDCGNMPTCVWIHSQIDLRVLFEILLPMTDVTLSTVALTQLDADPQSFRFVPGDVIDIVPQVKHMSTVSFAEGRSLMLQARSVTSSSAMERLRMLDLACYKFAAALRSTPDNASFLRAWGQAAALAADVYFEQIMLLHSRLEMLSSESPDFELPTPWDTGELQHRCTQALATAIEKFESAANITDRSLNLNSTLNGETAAGSLYSVVVDLKALFGAVQALIWFAVVDQSEDLDVEGGFVATNSLIDRAISHSRTILLATSEMQERHRRGRELYYFARSLFQGVVVADEAKTPLEKTNDLLVPTPTLHFQVARTAAFSVQQKQSSRFLCASADVRTFAAFRLCLSVLDFAGPPVPLETVMLAAACAAELGTRFELGLVAGRSHLPFSVTPQYEFCAVSELSGEWDANSRPLDGAPISEAWFLLSGQLFNAALDVLERIKLSSQRSELITRLSDRAKDALRQARLGIRGMTAFARFLFEALSRAQPSDVAIRLHLASILLQLACQSGLLCRTKFERCAAQQLDTAISIEPGVMIELSHCLETLQGAGVPTHRSHPDSSCTFENLSLVELLTMASCSLPLRNFIFLATSAFTKLDFSGMRRLTDSNVSMLVSNQEAMQSVQDISLADCIRCTDQVSVALSCSCPNLQRLSLAGCLKISDASGVTIGTSLRNLTHISFARCKRITDNGVIPLVRGCTMLYSMDLAGCDQVSYLAIIHLSRSSTLHELSIGKVRIPNLGGDRIRPDALEHFSRHAGSQLTTLVLANCAQALVESVLTTMIFRMPDLCCLDISGCGTLTDQALLTIASSCTRLEWLFLAHLHYITDVGVAAIVRDRKSTLRVLSLRDCWKVSTSAVEIWSTQGSQVEVLDAAHLAKFSPEAVDSVLRFPERKVCPSAPRLKVLSVAASKTGVSAVDDSMITYLLDSCEDSLTALDVSRCRLLSGVVLGGILGKFSQLTHLDVGHTKLTDTFLCVLGEHSLDLHYLDLSYCECITDTGIENLLARPHDCTVGLEHIGLCATKVTSKGVQKIAQHAQKLRTLLLAECSSVGPAGIRALSALRNLQNVDLEATRVDDASLLAFIASDSASLLEFLSVANARHLTAASVRVVTKFLPRLRGLDLWASGSNVVTSEVLEELATYAGCLEILNISDIKSSLQRQHSRDIKKLFRSRASNPAVPDSSQSVLRVVETHVDITSMLRNSGAFVDPVFRDDNTDDIDNGVRTISNDEDDSDTDSASVVSDADSIKRPPSSTARWDSSRPSSQTRQRMTHAEMRSAAGFTTLLRGGAPM